MPKHFWIRRLLQSLTLKTCLKSRRRRSRQTIEALEARMFLTTPTVMSINLVGAATTNATTTSWTATFSESVTGVDPSDFALAKTGTVGATLIQVTPVSSSTYTVTVSGLTGNGTQGLNLVDNDSIMNSTNVPLGGSGQGNGNLTGQVETLDHVSPFVKSINRTTPASATTNATSVSFTAMFSEPVTGVDTTSFALVKTGTAGGTITQVTPVTTSVYTVTVSGIGGNGTLGLNLVDSKNTIHDLAGNTLVTQNGSASFATQATFATGTGPISVKSGDFDRDGTTDLVIANRGSSSVSVLLGNGNGTGTFKAQQTFTTGANPYSVTVADVNGDSKSDLIVANRNGNSVSLLLGNGNGTFQTQRTFSVGTAPTSVTVGDVSGDGKLDLLVANESSNNISLLLGNGDGTFQAQQTIATGNLPQSIKIAEVNGDGKPDLFVTNRSSNSVSVLLGNGNGTFQAQQTISMGTATPYSLALSDFNGDGKPDLVVATSDQGGAIDLFLGNGNGTFAAGKTFAVSSSPQSVAIGDVNGDGIPDVFVASFTKSSVSVLLGNGNGTFQPQQTFATGNGPYSQSVAPVDINGDGRLDLAVANLSDNTVSVLLANGNGNFTGQVYTLVDQVLPSVLSIIRATPTTSTTNLTAVSYTVTFSEAVTGVDAADFSLAPTGTVAATTPVVTSVSSSVYTVAVGGITGIGSLGLNLVDNNSIHDVAGHPLTTLGAAASFANQGTVATGTQPKSVSLVDVNGDGKPDLVVANFNSSSVSVMLGNGNGTFQAQQTFATGLNPVSVATGDVDSDGRVDLVVANKGSSTVSVLLGNGNGIFRPQQTLATGANPYSVTSADVNGDGYSDVIVANYGGSTVSVLLGNGNGTFQAQRTFATGSNPRSVISTDLNGDGKLDIVAANYTNNGSVSLLLGNGNGTFQAQQTFATGSLPTSVASGDLNGDGKPDLAVANRGGSTVSVLLGNGNGTFLAQQTVATGTSPFSVVIGDVNGDGNLDLGVSNYSNNSVSVLLGNGNGTFQAQQTFATGSFPISITLGDVSSDGRPDLVVANSSGNSVSVLLGNLNGNFTGQIFTIATVPTVITPTSANITATTAMLGGNVSSDGGGSITERGVVYSLTSVNPNPRIGGTGVTKLTATGTTGVFTVNASSLSSGVSYSFLAYGINAIGTTYTSPVSTFTTLSTPIVTSPTSSNTTGTTAVLGGNVTSDGGSPVTERGVVYSLSSINQNPHIGGAGVTKVTASGTTGVFTVNVSQLTAGAGYSYAAYAINSFGTTYTLPIATFVPGLLIVNGVYSSSGQPINSGNTLTSPVTSVSVTFSAAMDTVNGGANSVTNPANWILTRYGIDVSNEISGITFAITSGSLNDVAVVSFSRPLVQGGYQLIARQSLYDATGQQLDGDGDGVSGGDFRINFYVTATVNGVTDVGPWLYQIESTPLMAPAPLTTPVTSSLLVFDADSNNWTGATIQITINYRSDQDVLGFVDTTNIKSSWNATTGTLILSGTDTVSNYRTALHNVTYHNTSSTPNTSVVRTVQFQTTDGILPSNFITRDLSVLSSSVPAVLSGVNGTGTYFQGDPSVVLATGLVITDPNTVNLASATISFTNWQAEDRLDFNNIFALQHTLTQDFTAHTATLMISGTDLVDHYQTLLRSVIYWDVSGNPVTSARIASISVSDGLSTSNILTRNTIVTAVDQSPTLTSIETSPLAYKANDPAFLPLPISNTLLVGDPDSNNLSKATVQITSGYENDANGTDLLSFTNQLGITGSFDATTGTLTLSGTSSVSNYRTALRTVTFSTSGSAVSTTNRTLTIIATDDYSPIPATSLPTTRSVSVLTTNVPPGLTGIPATALAYVRGATAAAVVPSAYVFDPDSINLASATVQITGNFQTGLDVLAAAKVTGITQAFDAKTGTLTLSGISSLASYQTVLQSVTFKTTVAANTTSRTLTFTINDGLADSSAVTRSITLA